MKIRAVHLSLPLKLPVKTASVFSGKDGVTLEPNEFGVVVTEAAKGKWSELIPWSHVKRCELEPPVAAPSQAAKKAG
jgi:hypothetical protein